MKTYIKSVFRTFKSNMIRFITITLIIFIGVCFVEGIGNISPRCTSSINDYYHEVNVSDTILKSSNPSGFTKAEYESIQAMTNVKYSQEITVMDEIMNEKNSRVYYYSIADNPINKLTLVEGSFPSQANEIVIEQSSYTIQKQEIGAIIDYHGLPLTITGFVENPLTIVQNGDEDIINQNPLVQIIYIDKSYTTLSLPTTDIWVTYKDSSSKNYFDDSYHSYIKEQNETIRTYFNQEVSILTLNENKSYILIDNICGKVNDIINIFPIFFIAVVALVVLTTMTRFIDEKRSIIGCYKSLGYSNMAILGKYLIFSGSCLIIGTILGLLSGAYILPNIIYPAFDTIFFMPAMNQYASYTFGIISSLIMFLVVMLVTVYVALKEVKDKPSNLLKYKAPKPGKKILLEKIGFIWNHLKFKQKSTYRNIFRYKGRLWMIIISVGGSIALVLAGFGLRNIANSEFEFEGVKIAMGDTLIYISAAVIMFASILVILVLFNLTNMNIAERQRELATLKVLGYYNHEVDGYVLKEILIMSVIGIVIGIPLGVAILYYIFTTLNNFGSLGDIQWTSYLYTTLIGLLLIGIVDLLLLRKINKVNMNDSLKSLE